MLFVEVELREALYKDVRPDADARRSPRGRDALGVDRIARAARRRDDTIERAAERVLGPRVARTLTVEIERDLQGSASGACLRRVRRLAAMRIRGRPGPKSTPKSLLHA